MTDIRDEYVQIVAQLREVLRDTCGSFHVNPHTLLNNEHYENGNKTKPIPPIAPESEASDV